MRARIPLCMRDATRAGTQPHQPSKRKLVLIYHSSLGNLKHDMPQNHVALREWQFAATAGFIDKKSRSLNLHLRLCSGSTCSVNEDALNTIISLCWPVLTNVRALSQGKGAGGQIAAQELCLAPPSQVPGREEVRGASHHHPTRSAIEDDDEGCTSHRENLEMRQLISALRRGWI
jgi:hypothetical protein